MWNPRWQPRNGCDGRLMAKFLITTIQVNLVPNPSETWRRQHKFTWIVVIKNFAISLPSQPFLGHHLGFHIFFHYGLFGAAPFLQLGCFGLDSLYRTTCEIRLWSSKKYIMTMFVNMNGKILTVSWKKSILVLQVFKAVALFYRLFTTFTNHLYV